MKKIAYLCDRKQDCRFSPSCGDLCRHTFDPDHAINGEAEDPSADNRFEEQKDCYWEIQKEGSHEYPG